MHVEHQDDLERVRERLRHRDPQSITEFLLSLAGQSGPVGEQVRAFIVADDLAATVASVTQRIGGLDIASEYEHRHARGREMGTRLEFIVESIERWVLPKDPKAAFGLLIALFEADAVAMENCGEHDWEVTCAYQRAAGVMAKAATDLPSAEVERRITALIDGDGYGVRSGLALPFTASQRLAE